MIYLDNAATTSILPCALEAMNNILRHPANPNSSHVAGQYANVTMEGARARIAKCINARPDEIHFTSGATEACQWAMQTLSENCCLTQVNATEHHAVLDCPLTTNAVLEPHGIAQMLANNETGEIFSAPRKGVPRTDLWFCDATAAMGHIPIDVKKLGADYLAAGGHKFGAPCGIGFLYAKRGVPLAERRAGTPPVALIAAMASALEWHVEHMAENTKHIWDCSNALYAGIERRVTDFRLNITTNRLPHILNISFDGVYGEAIAMMCSKHDVMVSAGAACTSGNHEPSHVLMAMYHDEERARGGVRISLSHDNTQDECEYAAKIIADCVEYFRQV